MNWLAVALTVFGVGATAAPVGEDLATTVARGAYLTRLAGCTDCHSATHDQYMAGGVRLDQPEFGVFYTPNITPDVETGIGAWSFRDFRRALRHGRSPRGMVYYPIFPYTSYTKLSDRDLARMWAYFRTIPPVRKQNRNHALNYILDNSTTSGIFSTRSLVLTWQSLARFGWPTLQNKIRNGFGAMPKVAAESDSWNRGAYLVEAAFHCTQCHTPRYWPTGLLVTSQWMSGANYKLNGHRVPNITPDELTGLGAWTADTWDRFLRSGVKPDGETPGYEMAWVIQNTASMTDADRKAVIDYLMHLPAVRSSHE